MKPWKSRRMRSACKIQQYSLISTRKAYCMDITNVTRWTDKMTSDWNDIQYNNLLVFHLSQKHLGKSFLHIEMLFLLLKRFKICGFLVKHCSIQLQEKAQAKPREDRFTAVYPEWSEISSSSKWQVIYNNYGKGAAPFFWPAIKTGTYCTWILKTVPFTQEKIK